MSRCSGTWIEPTGVLSDQQGEDWHPERNRVYSLGGSGHLVPWAMGYPAGDGVLSAQLKCEIDSVFTW